jgi:hypothetical protein
MAKWDGQEIKDQTILQQSFHASLTTFYILMVCSDDAMLKGLAQ